MRQVYALANDSVQAYLSGEIEFCRSKIRPGDKVLELGCGYGRIIKELASERHFVTGVDNAPSNIEATQSYLQDTDNVDVKLLDVQSLDFDDYSFDLVLCLQNGLSAFGLDPLVVLKEAWRVTKPSGRLVCSTYNDAFWPERLAWFRDQADAELLGAIDEEKTANGVIACTDGFVSRSTSEEDFQRFAESLCLNVDVSNLASGSLIASYTASSMR